jgi:hypothetical protein
MVKRDVVDILRRAFDNTLANWQIIALRLAEKVVLGVIAVGAALAILVPFLVTIGLHIPDSPEDLLALIVRLYESWLLILWIIVAVSLLLVVFIAVHSFVEAGCARIAIDADRAAGPAVQGPRARFRVFSMARWLAGATDGWWRVFWIYNLAWGALSLLLFIPMIPTMILMLVLRENEVRMIVTGIFGLTLTVMLFIAIAIVASVWTNRAIAECAAHGESARVALSVTWRALKVDFARHALIALAVFVVSMAGSSFFAGFGAFAAIGQTISQTALVNFVTMPMRMVTWLLSSAFSAAVATWFLAAYAALAVENN